MFIGEYHHSLDEKARITIPTKYRAILAKGAVVTRGLDKCLFLYTKEAWEALAVKLANLPLAQANARAFARLMLAGAMDVTPDRLGRMVLPDYLRTYASLGKNLVLAGLYNRLEIWGEEEWKKYASAAEKASGEIAEKLGELGV